MKDVGSMVVNCLRDQPSNYPENCKGLQLGYAWKCLGVAACASEVLVDMSLPCSIASPSVGLRAVQQQPILTMLGTHVVAYDSDILVSIKWYHYLFKCSSQVLERCRNIAQAGLLLLVLLLL